MDGKGVSALDGALLQQPGLSADSKFIAITLRGSMRETGSGTSRRRPGPKPGSAARSPGPRTAATSTG